MIPIRIKNFSTPPPSSPFYLLCHPQQGSGTKEKRKMVTESKRSKQREVLERISWGLKMPKKCSKFV